MDSNHDPKIILIQDLKRNAKKTAASVLSSRSLRFFNKAKKTVLLDAFSSINKFKDEGFLLEKLEGILIASEIIHRILFKKKI